MIGVNDNTGSRNGMAMIHPDVPVIAGKEVALTIVYTVGPEGVATGGCIRLGIWRYWSEIHLEQPEAQGFVKVDCHKKAVVLSLSLVEPKLVAAGGAWYQREGMSPNTTLMQKYHALYVEVTGGQLEEGDIIEFTYTGTAAVTSGIRYPFCIATDPNGGREAPYTGFSYISDVPSILVSPDEVVELQVFLPSQIEGVVNEGHSRIVGRDRFANPCEPSEKPIVTIEGRRVRVESGSMAAVSNYAALPDRKRLNCYWGDLHVHSWRSDGTGELEDIYTYARDTMGFDFVGHGDHAQYMSDEDWEDIKGLTRKMNDPGRFVSFPGFEISHNPRRRLSDGSFQRIVPNYGDKNVYYLDEDDAPIMRVTDRYRSYHARFQDIADQLKGKQATIIPHIHAGGVLTYYDPDLVWVIEAFSAHHFDLSRTGWERFQNVAQECLGAGWRIGLVGGSDNHNARASQDTYFPWKKESRRDSLMAVLAPDLTREALWNALQKRHVYATSGVRINMRFELNGGVMGDEIKVGDCQAPKVLEIEVHGTAPLDRVEILRSNEVIHTFMPGDWDFSQTYVDEEYSTGEDFYQLRIIQSDGNRAWSTPIWVDLAPEGRINFPGQEETWGR